MTPLLNRQDKTFQRGIFPANFPVTRLTENVLALSDAAVFVSRGDAIIYCTHSIVSLLGIQKQLLERQGWAELYTLAHPSDVRTLKKKLYPEVRQHFKKLKDEEKQKRSFTYTIRMRTGGSEYSLFALENRPLQWRRKDWPSSIVTVMRDITPFGNKAEMLLNIYAEEEQNYKCLMKRQYSFAAENFTGRESEIIRYVARGYTSIQIAEALCLSPETIRNHRKKILRKAGCKSSTALTTLALDHGII